MAKRVKRAEKGIESLKKQIEEHFGKIETDIREGNIGRGKYHLKEIDKGLLKALEIKIKILGAEDDNSVQIYRERLEELRKSLELSEGE
ncbi:MAG: hypothetical protein PHH54_03215 [Candidatus Nanoarchaeia archaeon]|nr:hypothetical protein [Candidatus Nanoarchaeia archaeon]MDD5740966.1 hypothetical protein [Candidatus Nanoarchaeia archaeon]